MTAVADIPKVDEKEKRPYARISLEINGDDKFKELTPVRPSGQSLWLYLLYGDFRTKVPGILLNASIGGIAGRLKGWTAADVKRHWHEIEKLKLGIADWPAAVVWLPKGLKHNPIQSPKVITGWKKVILPKCDLITRALRHLRQGIAEGYSKGFLEAFDEAYAEDYPEALTGTNANTGSGSGTGSSPPPYPPAIAGRRITRVERRLAAELLRDFRDHEHALYAESIRWRYIEDDSQQLGFRKERPEGEPYQRRRCGHHPECTDDGDCIVLIVLERRLREYLVQHGARITSQAPLEWNLEKGPVRV